MPSRHQSRIALRSAGKATSLLQAFSVLLLVVLVVIFGFTAYRYMRLQATIGDNALWMVFQMDREARKFHETLHDLASGHHTTDEEFTEALLKYDIVHSRVTVIDAGGFDWIVTGDDRMANEYMAARDTILEMAPTFDRIADGWVPPPEVVQRLYADMTDVLRKGDELLVHANNTANTAHATERDKLMTVQWIASIIVGALAICVWLMVFLVRRQLRSVQTAQGALEELAADLGKAYEAAEAGNIAKSRFMATVGHEIRTPLNAILGTAELMGTSPDGHRVREGAETIRIAGTSLLTAIDEVLDYAKLESGAMQVETVPTDLAALVREAVGTMRDSAKANGNSLLLEGDNPFEGRGVMSDPGKLRRILLNLLGNAVKFTTDGEIVLRLSERHDGKSVTVRFEVEDSGIGIDRKDMDKVFLPFTQADASISRRFGGTGLGLSICRELVQALGGRIGVESPAGRGSLFWFEVACEPCELTAQEHASPGTPLPRLRILLVEDNRTNQIVARGLLERLGQTVVVADSGQAAIHAARGETFDLVLMDMQMPGMDGIAAARVLRANAEGTQPRIVALTASASDEDRRLCMEAGMDGFQPKPVTLARLREVIAGTRVPPSCGCDAEVVPFDADFAIRRGEIVGALGEDGFAELVTCFFSDASEIVAGIEMAAAEEDRDAWDRNLHTLKGAAGNVGFTRLARTCQSLREAKPTTGDARCLRLEIEAHRQQMAA